MRGDVGAEDVFASLHGIFLAAGEPDRREQAGRMLDLLVDGLRPPLEIRKAPLAYGE